MSELLVNQLRAQAGEIARAGHSGWGNTMTWAADTLEKQAAEIAALREALMSISSGDLDYPEQCARRVLRELDKLSGGEV